MGGGGSQKSKGQSKSQNSKSEIRNTKQEQMFKIPMTKTVLGFEFRAWDLFRI